MKTNKTFAYGILAVIIALALAGCPDPEPTHTHDYATEWKSNAAQHWHECSCGDKTDIANHSGDPCAICGYASGSQNPDICECNGIAEDCDCDDCDCEVCEEEPPVNQPPTANAGTDQTVTLAGNLTITLSGTGADSDGNITAYAWECASYTADQGAVSAAYTKAQVDALIANANTATATVAPRKAGTYVFKLTVTDNDGESDTDTVTVVVESAGTVQKDVTVSYPNATLGTTINLAPEFSPENGWGKYFSDSDVTCTMTDTLGNIWNNETGFIVNASSYSNSTTYAFTQTFNVDKGSYVIRIRVSFGGFVSFRDANDNALNPSTVLPPMPAPLHLEKTITEIPPVAANAQAAPTHTLASDLTITLNGTGSAGNITAYAWECASYTADQGAVSAAYTKAQVDALIANANTATATVAPRKAGTYVFRLTVTGDEGESDTDTVAVVVGAMTHTITVPEISFNWGANLDFSQTITGWNSDFLENDVTYILKLGDTTFPSGTTSISASGRTSGNYTLTQTFYYKDEPISNGSRSVIVEVDTNAFTDMFASMPPPYTSVDIIPELPLLLSKGEL